MPATSVMIASRPRDLFCLHEVYLDQITQERDEDERETRAEHDRRERRHVPRHARVVARPGEPEHGDDQKRARKHRSVQAGSEIEFVSF